MQHSRDLLPIRIPTRRIAVSVLILFCIASPLAAYEFSALIALAEGALEGDNVGQPVAGFEIRLLKNGAPIFHQAFGDWSLNRPANADSSTKTLSGAVIMALVDSGDGGFSLESHLGDFLPEYDIQGLRDITVRQAFSHTSGIVGDEGSLILLNPNITLRQAATLISQKPLAYDPPGSTFSYGGLSMQAAGAAAEVAAGQAYVDLFAERIAGPLHLENTQFVVASDQNPRVAGGLETTAADFSRFMDMLQHGGVDRATARQVLSTNSVNEMFRRQTSDDQPIANSPTDNNRYGIGVWLDQLGQAGPTVDVLAAGARGFHSWIDRSDGLVFTFATDATNFGNIEVLSSMMHREILRAVPAADFDLDGIVDDDDLPVWQGSYGMTTLADADGDGDSDGADFLEWQRQLGTGLPAISLSAAVPEPATFPLLMLAATCLRRLSSELRVSTTRHCGTRTMKRPF
jgi:CubicO group peptidase (beta-lactamase class C family)